MPGVLMSLILVLRGQGQGQRQGQGQEGSLNLMPACTPRATQRNSVKKKKKDSR